VKSGVFVLFDIQGPPMNCYVDESSHKGDATLFDIFPLTNLGQRWLATLSNDIFSINMKECIMCNRTSTDKLARFGI